MKKGKLEIVRRTPEGMDVVRGVFTLVDTNGIPLDIVLDRLKDAKMMPDWLDFYDCAVAAGWKPEGIVSKLSAAVGDVYGPAFREPWEARLAQGIKSGVRFHPPHSWYRVRFKVAPKRVFKREVAHVRPA